MRCGQRPDVIVAADAEALARAAAERMLARLPRTDSHLAVCLTGGSTPERLYKLLATAPWRDAVPWKRIRWFWGDDRFVPESDPRSNAGAARRLMFDHVPAPPANICAMPIGADNVAEAAHLYEMELQSYYGADRLLSDRPLFDIVLMGVGGDGHTASLFPGHAELDEKTRWVVGVPEAGHEPFVPRVTLTFPALASTREMLFLVSGAPKREILGRVLAGDDLPAARAYSEGDLVWLVDQAAMPARDVSPAFHGSAGVRPASSPEKTRSLDRAGGTHRTPGLPAVIVVMGVSGAGKSTIAALLAQRLGWSFEDADWFHPRSNVEKILAGHPLTDTDRQEWLQSIAAWIKTTRAGGGHGVIACSALKRAYRDILRDGRDDVRFVYLKGDRDLIARRMSLRNDHFMPVTLLDSQFATLEEPAKDESAITVSIEAHPRDMVEAIVARLGIEETAEAQP